MPYSTAEAKNLDKFYTKHEAVERALDSTSRFLHLIGEEIQERTVIEPSAGGGAFLNECRMRGVKRAIALDIAPEHPDVVKADFTTWEPPASPAGTRGYLVLGNPPFGKGGRLALEFVNRSLIFSSVCAMILPLTFRKWMTQKKVAPQALLVSDEVLPADSFTLNESDYKVRCCFQIWTTHTEDKNGRPLNNLRILSAPPISHPDFECWQYNATPDARKYFDYDWDFGVLRQGYGDYTRHIHKGDPICEKKQWIFFKAKTPEALNNLENMDFEQLSFTNTSVRGFGKAQVVEEYIRRYGAGNV